MIIGERLKSVRKEKGISAKELSELLGVGERMITYYEANKKEPKIENLIKLADRLEVSIDYLCKRTDCQDIRKG